MKSSIRYAFALFFVLCAVGIHLGGYATGKTGQQIAYRELMLLVWGVGSYAVAEVVTAFTMPPRVSVRVTAGGVWFLLCAAVFFSSFVLSIVSSAWQIALAIR